METQSDPVLDLEKKAKGMPKKPKKKNKLEYVAELFSLDGERYIQMAKDNKQDEVLQEFVGKLVEAEKNGIFRRRSTAKEKSTQDRLNEARWYLRQAHDKGYINYEEFGFKKHSKKQEAEQESVEELVQSNVINQQDPSVSDS